MNILLTGASGFIGKSVLKAAQERNMNVRPVYRSLDSAKGQPLVVLVSGLDGATDWAQALAGIDIVIHAAARNHVMREKSSKSLAEYRRVNVEGTLNLARQAAAAGVRRFVFLSSIKVNGETSQPGRPIRANDAPAPEDAYGFSKAEAEERLTKLGQETSMELVIIRSPLVYGVGAKGNFSTLVNWVRRGFPLPLGGVTHNRRSLVSLDNLVDLILVCCEHANAANKIFLVSDGEDLSTAELVKRIGNALKRPARLFLVPTPLVALIAILMGKKQIYQRMLSSLQVDISNTRRLLSWEPPVKVDEGLTRAVE